MKVENFLDTYYINLYHLWLCEILEQHTSYDKAWDFSIVGRTFALKKGKSIINNG